MRLTAALLLSMTLLSGCASAQRALDSLRKFSAPQVATVIICPPELPAMPESAVDALVAAAVADPAVQNWLISVEKHYETQDALRPKCKAATS